MAEKAWPMNRTYAWANGKAPKPEAQAAATLIRESAEPVWDDVLGVWNVVADEDRMVGLASSPKHPAHDLFEWDDARAAEVHRHDRAVWLVRNVVVFRVQVSKVQGTDRRTTYRVEVPSSNGRSKTVQMPMTEILTTPEYKIQMVRSILDRVVRDARVLKDHVKDYPWLARLVREAERALKECKKAQGI